jgi:hypothetical protein
MPARKRGRKRVHVSKNLRASKKARAKLAAFLVDMEVPLNEAMDATHALRFIGYGLSGQGYAPEGGAISSLTHSLTRLAGLPAAR